MFKLAKSEFYTINRRKVGIILSSLLLGSMIGTGITSYLFIQSIGFQVRLYFLGQEIKKRNNSSIYYIYRIARINTIKKISLINHKKLFYKPRQKYKTIEHGKDFYLAVKDNFNSHRRGGDLQELEDLGFNNQEIVSLYFMNLVSGFWDFGNKHNIDKTGCVGINEDNKWQRILAEKITIQTYLQSNIGCCSDYAHFLKYLLDQERIKNRLVSDSDIYHTFNEVWLNGSWRVLDANTGLYINKSWEELLTQGGERGDLVIYQFPRHDASPGNSYRQVIPGFQIFMLQKALVGGTEKEIKDIEYPKLPEWFSRF